jgi:hypothetical protein
MCTWLNRRKRFTLGVGLGVVGVLVLAGWSPTLANGASGPEEGFVLLSMEQAARYRGTQIVYCCTGTGTYTGCNGQDTHCSDILEPGLCNSSVEYDYSAISMTYCTGLSPCGAGTATCDAAGTALCYTWSACHWVPFRGCQPTEPTHNSTWDNWICNVPAVPNP